MTTRSTEEETRVLLATLGKEAEGSPMGGEILLVCLRLARLLITKNKKYGNSALEPVRVFAKHLAPLDQILVRLDDKLSRLRHMGTEACPDEDTLFDLMGYLVLLRVGSGLMNAVEDHTSTPASSRRPLLRVNVFVDAWTVTAHWPADTLVEAVRNNAAATRGALPAADYDVYTSDGLRKLDPSLTLAAAGVRDGDTLNLRLAPKGG